MSEEHKLIEGNPLHKYPVEDGLSKPRASKTQDYDLVEGIYGKSLDSYSQPMKDLDIEDRAFNKSLESYS